MIKLPISDYVADFYKQQGIEFTLRQQASLCWHGHYLLKDQIKSLKEILEVSDDEKLNTEIRERITYEEASYESFITSLRECIYKFIPDNEEYTEQYFSSVKPAIAYGNTHCKDSYKIEKHYLFDKYPKESIDEDFFTLMADYSYTSNGDVISGYTCEYFPYSPSADNLSEYIDDKDRFENAFLNIKSPFGVGDIVMGPNYKHPCVVGTNHDYFEEIYDRHKNDEITMIDYTDNFIILDYISMHDGRVYYDHIYPFNLWKIDSWEDHDYWEILQMISRMVKADVAPFTLNYRIQEYIENH